jgi:hypothetical protein
MIYLDVLTVYSETVVLHPNLIFLPHLTLPPPGTYNASPPTLAQLWKKHIKGHNLCLLSKLADLIQKTTKKEKNKNLILSFFFQYLFKLVQ